MELDRRVKECAMALGDSRLLAKLANGDMIAIEAKYHASCLAQLYNRRRSLERAHYQQLSTNTSLTESLNSVVFAQLTAYIEEVRSVANIAPHFKLADLKKLYGERLQQLNATDVHPINSTRLKEKLLKYFPDLQAHSDGRDVLLAFDENIGFKLSAACNSSMDEDAVHLAKAAEIVRRDVFSSMWHSEGSLHFASGCQEKSVPQSLLALVSMILEGPSIDMQSAQQTAPASVTIAQLMVFNSVRHKRSNRITSAVRHTREQETQLPLYVGLAVHAATRKKRLVDKLYSLGLSISYDRVLSLLDSLTYAVCHQSELEHVVYPAHLKTNIFTTAAVDNIDHNPSSTSARSSFHGTGLSLHQHPDSAILGVALPDFVFPDNAQAKQSFALPESYSHVPFVRLLSDEPAVPTTDVESISGASTVVADDFVWLNNAWQQWQNQTFTVS